MTKFEDTIKYTDQKYTKVINVVLYFPNLKQINYTSEKWAFQKQLLNQFRKHCKMLWNKLTLKKLTAIWFSLLNVNRYYEINPPLKPGFIAPRKTFQNISAREPRFCINWSRKHWEKNRGWYNKNFSLHRNTQAPIKWPKFCLTRVDFQLLCG